MTGPRKRTRPATRRLENDDALVMNRKQRRTERRTFFFNFAHEAGHDTATYYLVGGGNHVRLRRVKNNPAVLKRHRAANNFLRAVPDHQLTHFVENVRLSADSVSMSYVKQNPDTAAGTWNMSAMYFHIPTGAVAAGAARRVERAASGELPLSAKRKLYGLTPAATARDLTEEAILLDPSDHATAIIGVHPDLLSIEPHSASTVHSNYIGPNGATAGLAVLLQQVGAATPQQNAGQPNENGWATMTPAIDDDTGQPYLNQHGKNKGLIQYHPAWNPLISNMAQSGAVVVLPQVKNDESLGGDVTGADPNKPPSNLTGALWKRHDGVTTVDQTPTAGRAAEDTLSFTVTTSNTESGFSCTGSAVESNGTVTATLTFTNWYVRWLGIYLLFLDAAGNPVDPAGTEIVLPSDYDAGPDQRSKLNNYAAMFAFLLGPEFTFLGIPMIASTATMSFDIPSTATTVRVFASGPSNLVLFGVDPNDPTTWGDWLPGTLTTLLLNYGLTAMLMVAGASSSIPILLKAALSIAPAIFSEIATLVGDAFRNQDFSKPDVWAGVGMTLVKSIAALSSWAVSQFIALVTAQIAVGELEDSIPLAGQIALGISLAAGAATLLETTIEIAESPVSYVYDLTLAHDLSVTILPDPNDDKFPAVATYYKVTAQFDQTVSNSNSAATPVTQTLQITGTVSTLPPVVFKNVPFGGNVNVSVGFYSADDWLAGSGTTGVVSNSIDTLPDITIQEFKVPIQATTVYEHKQKTVLTDAQSTHGWLVTATGPRETQQDLSCESPPGNLCRVRGITVRQGTAAVPGYVGYVWQSSSAGIVACGSGATGQMVLLANMGDVDPQNGYTISPCGLQSGSEITYSLFSNTSGPPGPAASNFYLDTTSNVVRRVRLDLTPPEFDPPLGGEAWGALNLESTDLLLHPSGRLVSINNALHKMEILNLPSAPLADADAQVKLLARVHAGAGTRPGLIMGPVAAAVSPDGVVLVLENDNSRIQAFDIGGNPVQFFKQQPVPYFLNLTATADGNTEYLDLAIEYTGYLYVLSCNGPVYRLDIYNPGQVGTGPICTTMNINAAKLAVDFWRNVYTLNYEMLLLPGGAVPPVSEPSVSLWIPSTP